MRTYTDQVARTLEKGLAPVWLIAGDEPLLTGEAADLVRARARKEGFTGRDLFVTDRSFDWSEVATASRTLSLFSERRILEIRMPTARPGKEGGAALAALAADPGPDNLVLVITTRPEKDAWSSAWLKAFEKHGVFVQSSPVEIGKAPAVDFGARVESRTHPRARGGGVPRRARRGQPARCAAGNREARTPDAGGARLDGRHAGGRRQQRAVQRLPARRSRARRRRAALAADPRGTARRGCRAAARPVGALPRTACARRHAKRHPEEDLWRQRGAPRGARFARGEAHRAPADRALVCRGGAHRPAVQGPGGQGRRGPVDIADRARRRYRGR